MKLVFLHLGYFIALIILSFLSFFVILSAGFVGKINIVVLIFPFIFSVLWLSDYTWRILSTNPDKIQLFRPTKDWVFISLFLSGICTVYSLFLTTLVPTPIEPAPTWMFLGTPITLLLIWYWILYRYARHKITNRHVQWVMSTFHLTITLIYTYQICNFYVIQFF